MSELDVEVLRAGIPIGVGVSGPRKRIGPEDKVLKPYPLKKVIILGMGFSMIDFIHQSYGNPSHLGEEGTEIWAINYAGFTFNADVIFNLHDFEDHAHHEVMKAYAKLPNTKIVSIRSYDWLPNSWEYPLQEILEDPLCGVPYLTNTTAYLIAFAIACRVPEIQIYGCDFDYDEKIVQSADGRYERGRANVEFWIGKAVSFGINVTVAPSGTLLNASVVARSGTIEFYGYGRYKSIFSADEGMANPSWNGFQVQPIVDLPDGPLPINEGISLKEEVTVTLHKGTPPATDDFVAPGSSLFSDPTKMKAAAE